ncbi:MAG: diacylglycerol kinase family protein [Clostridiaceae bacterium]|nr:diacylglycerol kinase family protein [Clostridiaceae bacterium]
MKNRMLKDSFKYAGQGIKEAFATERNFKIHCLATLLVIVFGILFNLPLHKWVILFLAIGFVLVCELINTAGEVMVDMITKEYSVEAKKVKDLLAGAVLISAATAFVTGILVFIDPVIELITRIF